MCSFFTKLNSHTLQIMLIKNYILSFMVTQNSYKTIFTTEVSTTNKIIDIIKPYIKKYLLLL